MSREPGTSTRRARWLRRAGFAAGLVACLGLVVLAAGYRRARLLDPEPTVLLLDRDGRFLAEVESPAHDQLGYWPLARLPPRVVAATLAAEDRRFREHPGVDGWAVLRAAAQNLRAGRRISGASTLAMQVARLQDPGPRTWTNKLLEASAALWLTARHGRQGVLGQYLRLAPYGRRIRGIAYAARRYFEKPVEDLTWGEVALLVSLPQAPGRMNPYHPTSRGRAPARARRVLATLAEEGVLGEDELRLARRQVRDLDGLVWSERPREALHAILRMEEELRGTGRRRHLVESTLDLELQLRVTELARLLVEHGRRHGVGNAACLVVEREVGAVRAAVGSVGWGERQGAGSYDYTRVRRSPGSALKPFLYAQALDRGVIDPGSVLDDLRRAPGAIENADDRFLGPLLPRTALANSRNVPAVNLLRRLGVDEFHAFLGELGLHDHARPASHYGEGLVIGTLPVALEDLARAYLVLAGDGRLRPLRWHRDASGEAGPRLLSEEAARLVTRYLADPDARLPTFPRGGFLELPFPAAAKTGTSSRRRDALCVGWTRHFLVAAWLGHPDHEPMKGVTGYTGPARLVRQVLHDLLTGPGAPPAEEFPAPEGWDRVPLCALSGARAREGCVPVLPEFFPPGRAPLTRCQVHERRLVDTRTGALAGPEVPEAHRALRTFVRLPTRYGGWARAAGLEPPPDGAPAAASAPGDPYRPHLEYGLTDVAVRITEPRGGTRLIRDPESAAGTSSLALDAEVEPPSRRLVWYVDGRPFRTVPAPYRTRWPLEPGEHVFEARVPYTDFLSRPVRVRVD